MSDLTAFLLARLDEDEALAMAATYGPWYVDEVGDIGEKAAVLEVARWRGYTNTVNFGEDQPTADHIARHDPPRVLADVQAKRALIEFAITLLDGDDSEPYAGEIILVHLATAYDEHPDYDEAWRP